MILGAVGGMSAYRVTVQGARAQSSDKYVLYPATSLTYVLIVSRGALTWEVPRRYSEIKKFWESLRPIAAAAGASLTELQGLFNSIP